VAFLAPLWLSLAALAAVPVLLHLLRRNIATRTEFPAVRYLQSAQKESSKDVRAKNLWLLVLRVLLMLLLALAAAGPVWTSGEGTPRRLAIVLDNSLSTGAIVDGAPVLARLTAAARELRAASGSAEGLWLITADGTEYAGRDAIDAALARVVALPNAGRLDAALARAIGRVRGESGNDGVVAVLTDGQASAISALQAPGRTPVRLFVPALQPPPNGAILSAVAAPAWWTPRGTLELTVRPVRDSTAYRVAIGDSTLARGVLVRARGDSIAGSRIPLVASGTGWQSLDVTVEASGIGEDDHAAVAINVGRAPTVRDAAGPFTAAAVAALRETGRVRAGADGAVQIAPAASVTALPAIILPPADAGGLAAANAALARLDIPWRYASAQTGGQRVRSNQRDLRGDTAIRVTQWFPLVAQGAAAGDTSATIGNTPWMVRSSRWLLLGSALDPAATTLPTRAVFVPWLADVISQLSSRGTTPTLAYAGDALAVPAGATELRALDGTQRQPVRGATLPAPSVAGVYQWMRASDPLGIVTVALAPGEPLLARATPAALRSAFGGSDRVIISADAATLVRSVRQQGAPRPLLTPVLLLALLIALAEAWLSGRFRTRPASDLSPRAA
jgi:hypothetical protein